MKAFKQDLQDIRQIVIEGVEAITGPRFDTLEADVAELKSDVAVLKTDTIELKTDFTELKGSMRQLSSQFDTLDNRAKALESDTKGIYTMLSDLQHSTITDKSFQKRSLEEKLLTIHAEVISMAKQAGVTLPR